MSETQGPGNELHDELLETRSEHILGWYIDLPGALQVVLGCGAAIVIFILGAVIWGLLIAFIF